MSRIIIIGNGFDKAHGLATDYGSFVKWYLCKCVKKLNKENNWNYGDKLVRISWTRRHDYHRSKDVKQAYKEEEIRRDNSLRDLSEENVLDFCNQYYDKSSTFSFSCNSEFFKKIFRQVEYNWVDIEDTFFKSLIAKSASLNFINEEFAFLREELIEYLTEVQDNAKNHIIDGYIDRFSKNNDDLVFVNFNYTNTIEPYAQYCRNTQKINGNKRTVKVIYIHGRLDFSCGEPIFGIGDEYHDDYIRLNDSDHYKEFLEYSKSQWYFRNNNYNQLESSLDGGVGSHRIDVYGHSCGRSDKTLLKFIFQHKKISEINLFHFNGEEDYINKTKELSRHFDDNPLLFRHRVKPYNPFNVMPQLVVLGKESKDDNE